MTDKLDGMEIQDQKPAGGKADVPATSSGNMPAQPPSKLQSLNTGFDGIGDSTFAEGIAVEKIYNKFGRYFVSLTVRTASETNVNSAKTAGGAIRSHAT